MIKKILLLSVFALLFHSFSYSQEIESPVWTVKSHSNLDIEKIIKNEYGTVFQMIVKSDMDNGAWFCADKNIFLVSIKDSIKYKLIKSANIPVCPELHEFKKKGELLRFKLYFPPIPSNITSVSLIEDCDNSCFYFTDIVLDITLSKEIKVFENAIEDYRNQHITKAIEGFEFITSTCKDKSSYRYSHSLSILPILYEETKQLDKAETYYHKILTSSLVDNTPTGEKNEHFSNFKHKASLRLALLYSKLENYGDALKYLDQAKNKYPIQALESEEKLVRKDHFLILNNELKITNKHLIDSYQTMKLIFTEYINMPYGEIPASTIDIINEVLSEGKPNKKEKSEKFNHGLITLQVYEKESQTIVKFFIADYKFEIISSEKITADEAKSRLQKIEYFQEN